MLAGDPGKPVDLVINDLFPGFSAETDIQVSRDAAEQQQHNSDIRQRIPDEDRGPALSDHGLFLLPAVIDLLVNLTVFHASVFFQL